MGSCALNEMSQFCSSNRTFCISDHFYTKSFKTDASRGIKTMKKINIKHLMKISVVAVRTFATCLHMTNTNFIRDFKLHKCIAIMHILMLVFVIAYTGLTISTSKGTIREHKNGRRSKGTYYKQLVSPYTANKMYNSVSCISGGQKSVGSL